MIKGICTSKSSPYIALVLLVLLTNLIIAPRYYSNSEELSPDPALYHETAKAIARGETEVLLPSGNRHDIGYLMAPGYSYLLAGVYGLFSPMPVYGYFLNILFHVAAILLIFYLASKVMNLFFAGFLTVWLNFYFLLWRMNFSLMMEISTLFLLILSFYFLYRFVSSKKIYTLVCSGLSFGYLMFLNNRFLLHFIILL